MMKSHIQKITSIFLLIIFLISGLGFTLNKMVCLKNGKTKIWLMHEQDCCDKKSNSTVIKSQCCDQYSASFNLDDFSASPKTDAPVVSSILLPFEQKSIVPLSVYNKNSAIFYTDTSPPRYGRQLLSLISILII